MHGFGEMAERSTKFAGSELEQMSNAKRDHLAPIGAEHMDVRSNALDWNSSNIFTGVPGFD
jgi:hypothetical protein